MCQILTQLLDTMMFKMIVQFLVRLSFLNLLCQHSTHIVNSESYVSRFDPITRHSGVHNESSVFSTFVNFEPFLSTLKPYCQF